MNTNFVVDMLFTVEMHVMKSEGKYEQLKTSLNYYYYL